MLGITGLAMSMVLNALVMGLMALRISKMFQRLKPALDEQILSATGGSTLRPMIFVLIESGMALVSIQLVQLVVASLVVWTDSEGAAGEYQLGVSYCCYGNICTNWGWLLPLKQPFLDFGRTRTCCVKQQPSSASTCD